MIERNLLQPGADVTGGRGRHEKTAERYGHPVRTTQPAAK